MSSEQYDEFAKLKQITGFLTLVIPLVLFSLTYLYYKSIFPVLPLKLIVGILILIPFSLKTFYKGREVVEEWEGTNYREISLFALGSLITLGLIIALSVFYVDVIGFFIFIFGG